MYYFFVESVCLGQCSVFLDKSKRLKVNLEFWMVTLETTYLESQKDLLKR
jgi:hypothetical protein